MSYPHLQERNRDFKIATSQATYHLSRFQGYQVGEIASRTSRIQAPTDEKSKTSRETPSLPARCGAHVKEREGYCGVREICGWGVKKLRDWIYEKFLCEDFLDDFGWFNAGEALVEALEFVGHAFVIDAEGV